MSIEYNDKEKFFNQELLIPNFMGPVTNPYPNDTTSQPNPLDTFIQNTEAGTINMSQGSFQSPNFSTGVAGWKIDSEGSVEFGSGVFRGDITGATGTFSGTVNVGSLNIPDTTTANSFHVDATGNAWWGANVASGLGNAKASITSAGLATFKNVLVGGSTIQYQMSDNGIYTYGDGSDGVGVADGTTALAGASLASNVYTITRDVYYTNLTVSGGVTINAKAIKRPRATSLR